MSEPAKWSKEWWTEERMEQMNYYEDPSAATDPDVRYLLMQANGIVFAAVDKDDHTFKAAVRSALSLWREHGVPSANEWPKLRAERKAARES